MTTEQHSEDELLDRAQLCALLKIPASTPYAWRYRGVGPPAMKVGKHLRWRRSDVDAWLLTRTSVHRA